MTKSEEHENVDQESIDRLDKFPSIEEEKMKLAKRNPKVRAFLFGSNTDYVLELKKLPKTRNPGHSDARI